MNHPFAAFEIANHAAKLAILDAQIAAARTQAESTKLRAKRDRLEKRGPARIG